MNIWHGIPGCGSASAPRSPGASRPTQRLTSKEISIASTSGSRASASSSNASVSDHKASGTPKFHLITLILKSLHRLKINERLKYKILSLTYKSLKSGQPSYLRSLLSFPSHCSTRSFSLITLTQPSLTSRLKIANRSFYHSTLVLCNNLPYDLRQVAHNVHQSRLFLIFRLPFS
jgi:hypothetical protein